VQIPKATKHDIELFAETVQGLAGVVVKPMFANVGAFVNGNMFAGLFGEDVGVKLIETSSLEELNAIPGTRPYGPVERPMRGWTSLPAEWGMDSERARAWIERAFVEVGTVPPKQPKATSRS
jgi:TfoX/Sxy family transcriptional regulator of competence genes